MKTTTWQEQMAELADLPASQRLFNPTGWAPPVLTAQVRSADGDIAELCKDLAEAQRIADAWNAETDPCERAHSGAYPFRAELRS